MRLRTVRFALSLIAFGTACGGSQGGQLVQVAPASHNNGAPVSPWARSGDRSNHRGPPHAGSWTPTRTFQATRFTIEYPVSARAYLTTDDHFSQPVLWVQDLPECTASCEILVTVSRVRENVTLDSVVHSMTSPDPRDAGRSHAHVIDTTTIGGRRTFRIAIDCRGCSETVFVTERHGWAAQIGMGMCTCDSALASRLEEIVRSFRWTDPPAARTPPP